MNSSAGAWRADYRLRPSRLLLAASLALHALAGALILLSAAPLWLKLLCLPPVLGLAVHSVKPLRLRTQTSITALREYGEDWWLDSADGQGRRVMLLPDQLLWRYLLVLRFAEPEAGGRVFHVPVLPDSLAADDFRRLYVRLLFRRGTVAEPDQPE